MQSNPGPVLSGQCELAEPSPGELGHDAVLLVRVAEDVVSMRVRQSECYSISAGDRAAKDEMCVTVAYYFPADDSTGHFCLGSNIIL